MRLLKKHFIGLDVSKEISLLEYGLLMYSKPHPDGSGSHFFVYSIGGNMYGTAHIYPNDIDSLLSGKDWADADSLDGFFSFIGVTNPADYISESDLLMKVSDLLSYYGTENIMGSEYYPMTEKEAKKRYL